MFLAAYWYKMQSDNTDAMTILSSGQLHPFSVQFDLSGGNSDSLCNEAIRKTASPVRRV